MKYWIIRTLSVLAIISLIAGWDTSQLTIVADVIIIAVWVHMEWHDWARAKINSAFKR